MSRPAAAWGVLMCGLAALGVTVFAGDAKFAALMFGAGAGALAVAGVLLTGVGERARTPAPSPGAALLAAGLVLVCLGGAWGLWLVWIGCGVAVAGVGGLVLEARR